MQVTPLGITPIRRAPAMNRAAANILIRIRLAQWAIRRTTVSTAHISWIVSRTLRIRPR
ncbi:hypothetical protein FHU31_001745 [Mycolicibacterium fluoranthenivorans]|uniref:Uncharacterized protein n=1 Tax=Mycolicibacterium fluoranthenivorans TaxID=258505 RepID=A0A7X5TXX7_9MYCO|nr:hypothetical protein [Mycolicibacterium fluoranthenivorans]